MLGDWIWLVFVAIRLIESLQAGLPADLLPNQGWPSGDRSGQFAAVVPLENSSSGIGVDSWQRRKWGSWGIAKPLELDQNGPQLFPIPERAFPLHRLLAARAELGVEYDRSVDSRRSSPLGPAALA